MKESLITAEYLRTRMLYDPETGIFTWLKRSGADENWKIKCWNTNHAEKIAGTIGNHGYSVINFNQKLYLAHRLAWLYMTGDWPTNQIDHINLIRTDNRFSNLRAADRSQNGQNRRMKGSNQSGFKGVDYHKKRRLWRARKMWNRKNYHIGWFKTAEEATIAYIAFVKSLNSEFARL